MRRDGVFCDIRRRELRRRPRQQQQQQQQRRRRRHAVIRRAGTAARRASDNLRRRHVGGRLPARRDGHRARALPRDHRHTTGAPPDAPYTLPVLTAHVRRHGCNLELPCSRVR